MYDDNDAVLLWFVLVCLLLILPARPHVYYIRPLAYIITMHCFNISQYVILKTIWSKLCIYIYNAYHSIAAHVQILTVNAERSLSYRGSVSMFWTWWRHQMETFPTLLALCEGNPLISSGFPSQRPVTRSFDVFFDLRLNEGLSKQSIRWWFETPSRSLWRNCNDIIVAYPISLLVKRIWLSLTDAL